MEVPINLLKIELESNQKQCEYYKGVDNNLAIQYKKRVVEIKRAIDLLERALAEPSDENAVLPIHSVRLSLPHYELYKKLDDKRMKKHVDSEGVWHLYLKQTAETLLDDCDIYEKGNEA